MFQRSFIALDYPGSRVCFDEEEDDDDEGDNDIETVMAATPAHSIMEPPQNGVTMATVQASPGPSSNTQSAQTGQQMSTNETHILKVNFRPILFSPFNTCKRFHHVLNSLRHACVLKR